MQEKNNHDEIISAISRATGLEVPEEIRPQVADHFAVLASHAARIMTVEIDDEVEPAPVFRP